MIVVYTLPRTGTRWFLQLLKNIEQPFVHIHPGRISKHGEEVTRGYVDPPLRQRKAIALYRPEADQRASLIRNYGGVLPHMDNWYLLREMLGRHDRQLWVDLYNPDYGELLHFLDKIPPRMGHNE